MRTLIRAIGWLVPRVARRAWLGTWLGRVEARRWLADRGEPVGGAGPLLRRALREAAGERLGPIHLRPLVRSPWFVPVVAAVALLLLAGVSHGFAKTRSVLSIAQDLRAYPAYCGVYDARGDRVFAYAAPTVLAWLVGLALLATGCRSLRASGWRYWTFLVMKAAAAAAGATLVWAEVGWLLRAPIAHEGWRALLALLSVFVYVGGAGRTMLWVVEDQRLRCPVCLQRMVAPVAVGSWASTFEPAATEMLCENGHGALALADAETNARDRWTRLDESWQTLFR